MENPYASPASPRPGRASEKKRFSLSRTIVMLSLCSWLLVVLLAVLAPSRDQLKTIASPIIVVLGISALLIPPVTCFLSLIAFIVAPHGAGCLTLFAIPVSLLAWYEAAFLMEFCY
jgi:hypothetical protein